jgi:CRP-like cAMP-binding protein
MVKYKDITIIWGENMKVTKEDILKIEAFKEIKAESIHRMVEIATKIKLKKNEVLFMEKDYINALYAILDGKATMFRLSSNGQKRVFFILTEGALINEVVFDQLPVSVDCEAFEDSTILKFSKDKLIDIMENDFKLTMNIMNSLGKKERRLFRQLKNSIPIKLEKKIAAKLWKLSKDYGIAKGEWTEINLKITITYLSYMIGSSRETVSRALKTLIDENIVRWDEKKLLVLEEKLLEYYRFS